MNQATALLGLISETSLHAGAGTSAGVIDLPIQREGHNGWPCVFGSAVKGALRDLGESRLGKASHDVHALFGPDTANAADNAGAIAVGDARLLLLPVRSLTTAFKWVTCPEALQRFKRDASRLGIAGFDFAVPQVTDAQARVAKGMGDLFLEEYRFTLHEDSAVKGIAESLARLLSRERVESELTERLTLISNDLFTHLARSATPVNAHIALDSETKTVIDGALWYEETLPPETVLYAPILANNSRKKDFTLSAMDVLGKVAGLFGDRPWLQLGGNETVGMGWCAVHVLKGGA
jgi:CRISPR-associated protein Cmr4